MVDLRGVSLQQISQFSAVAPRNPTKYSCSAPQPNQPTVFFEPTNDGPAELAAIFPPFPQFSAVAPRHPTKPLFLKKIEFLRFQL